MVVILSGARRAESKDLRFARMARMHALESEGVMAADERVADVSFDEDSISVRLNDGRTISAPLAW